MKFGLTEKDLDKLYEVLRVFPNVEKVIIFGSRAMDKYKPGSDIDLAFFGKNLDTNTLNKIEWQFEELNMPYTFDLILFNKINNQAVIDHINRVGKVFYP